MSYGSFLYQKIHYDLSHLDPKILTFSVAAHKELPARQFKVLIEYSDHCFTEDEKPGHDLALYYATEFHGGKPFRRMFELKRWQLSSQLPSIIEGLLKPDRWVYFTNGKNFHIFESTTSSGDQVKYLIYFVVKRREQGLRLVIESAYPYDPSLGGTPPKIDIRVRFSTILRNIFDGKPLRKPSKR